MKAWRLFLSHRADVDLTQIYGWIAENTSETTADRYVARLEAFFGRLRHYPKRAQVRDDLLPRLRLIGFEKSVTVAFVVDDARGEVRVLRLLYRGQRLEI